MTTIIVLVLAVAALVMAGVVMKRSKDKKEEK